MRDGRSRAAGERRNGNEGERAKRSPQARTLGAIKPREAARLARIESLSGRRSAPWAARSFSAPPSSHAARRRSSFFRRAAGRRCRKSRRSWPARRRPRHARRSPSCRSLARLGSSRSILPSSPKRARATMRSVRRWAMAVRTGFNLALRRMSTSPSCRSPSIAPASRPSIPRLFRRCLASRRGGGPCGVEGHARRADAQQIRRDGKRRGEALHGRRRAFLRRLPPCRSR